MAESSEGSMAESEKKDEEGLNLEKQRKKRGRPKKEKELANTTETGIMEKFLAAGNVGYEVVFGKNNKIVHSPILDKERDSKGEENGGNKLVGKTERDAAEKTRKEERAESRRGGGDDKLGDPEMEKEGGAAGCKERTAADQQSEREREQSEVETRLEKDAEKRINARLEALEEGYGKWKVEREEMVKEIRWIKTN